MLLSRVRVNGYEKYVIFADALHNVYGITVLDKQTFLKIFNEHSGKAEIADKIAYRERDSVNGSYLFMYDGEEVTQHDIEELVIKDIVNVIKIKEEGKELVIERFRPYRVDDLYKTSEWKREKIAVVGMFKESVNLDCIGEKVRSKGWEYPVRVRIRGYDRVGRYGRKVTCFVRNLYAPISLEVFIILDDYRYDNIMREYELFGTMYQLPSVELIPFHGLMVPAPLIPKARKCPKHRSENTEKNCGSRC